MKKTILYLALAGLSFSTMIAQDSEEIDHKITLSTYVDGYYAGYTNDLSQRQYQPFITVGARGNSFGVNVAQFGVKYEHDKVRGNFLIHYGDIPGATWSDDFNTIQEANVGLKLAEGIWLDAGFFATHIGTESFLPKNNMLSSTAFKTYNEPFYQSGAKLTFDQSEDWEVQLWVLNGYNSLVDNNDAKSVGALVSYNINDQSSVTYTNIYGLESRNDAELKQARFYQNIYLNQSFMDKVFLSAGFDFGFQTNSDLEDPEKSATMYAGLATIRYQFNPEVSITGRAEIFNDRNGFIGGTVSNNANELFGFELMGFTVGTEYRPIENAYLRAEVRQTIALNEVEIFRNENGRTNNRFEILFTLGLELEKVLGF